jgi:cell division protein DivIC
LEVQAAELQEQIAAAEEEYEELESKEEYMKTKKYVEDVARNQLGLVYPDEIVIRPEE